MRFINNYQIEENIKILKEKNELMLVLKNNAYGMGLTNVFLLARNLGVKRFAVNDVFEGIRLRKLDKNISILVFGVNYRYLNIIKEYNLIPTTSNIEEYLFYMKKNIEFALEIDSGMNRFGFKRFKQEIIKSKLVKFIYVHFATINKIEQKIKKYDTLAKMYNKEIVYGGSMVIPYTSKCVRIGISLYENALEMYGRIKNIKVLNKNEVLGYDETYVAKTKILVGIVNIGYKNGINIFYDGEVYINESRYKVIGKVCMNHLFILIDEKVRIGDLVEIIGKNILVEEFNLHNKTNIYQTLLFTN